MAAATITSMQLAATSGGLGFCVRIILNFKNDLTTSWQVCYPKISNDKNIGSMLVALPNVWEVLEDARVWLPRYIVRNGRE